MTDAVIPLGWHQASERMVTAEEVPQGLACGCVCPGCYIPLVAAHGTVYRHHFRHHAEGGACGGGYETALHKFAKQIICEKLDVALPVDLIFHPGAMASAAQEVWLDGLRPDVLAQYQAEPVAFEIKVAHPVPVEKVKLIHARQLACLEIDLSYHRRRDMTVAELTLAVLHTADRHWLCDLKAVRMSREEELWQRHAAAMRARAEATRLKDAEAEMAKVIEVWRRQEAVKQAAIAEAEALLAEQRFKEAEEQARQAALAKAELEARARAGEWPNLQKLIEAYGGFDKITEEAWLTYDGDVEAAKYRARFGE